MLKQLYNYLSKNTVTLVEVSRAISESNEEKTLKLILKGQDAIANLSIGPYPLLQISLTNKFYSCTAALLKFGADPNKDSRGTAKTVKIIQGEIIQQNKSNIRILLLNGANLDGVSLERTSESLKDFIGKKTKQHKKIKELQNAIHANPSKKHLTILLETLVGIWQEEAIEQESIPAYKSYYQEKANEYLQNLKKLEKADAICESTAELQHRDNEHKPLISKIKTH